MRAKINSKLTSEVSKIFFSKTCVYFFVILNIREVYERLIKYRDTLVLIEFSNYTVESKHMHTRHLKNQSKIINCSVTKNTENGYTLNSEMYLNLEMNLKSAKICLNLR